jgi:hypothetical protein
VQGVFLGGTRPKTKKAIKEAIEAHYPVMMEATSVFGNEYDGSIYDAPDGKYNFVGPDPHTKRNFYGTITKSGDKITVK